MAMPRTPPRRTKTTSGRFRVANPHGIPAGHVLIRHHVCIPSMKDERDAAKHRGVCNEQRWREGEAFDPPEGFGLDRFLQHQPMPGASCGDDSHENCAGPFLVAAEEVSTDGV